jgi:hypothetical protein
VPSTSNPENALNLVMHEYDAARAAITAARANQVAALSFGVATVALITAAAATLWNDAEVLSGLLLLVVLPTSCFIALSIYAGELMHMIRTELFVNHLENWVSDHMNGDRFLVWQEWSLRRGTLEDVERTSALAIPALLVGFASTFAAMGYLRLHAAANVDEWWVTAALVVGGLLAIGSLRYAALLIRFAFAYRMGFVVKGTRAESHPPPQA